MLSELSQGYSGKVRYAGMSFSTGTLCRGKLYTGSSAVLS
jgi:hypothetical protein